MTYRLAIQLCAVTLLSLLQACGSQDEARLSAANTPLDERPLFVVMGGNTSCTTDQQNRSDSPYATDLYRNAYHRILKNRDLETYQWRYIASCYTSSATVYYATSEAPNDIKGVDRQDFERIVKESALLSKASFLTGHSYGGWLAMKVALQMQKRGLKANQSVDLYTVDPISRTHCSFDQPFGCQEAPQDFGRVDRQSLNDVTRTWLNFYQTRTWYLHSDEMEEADENFEINAKHNDIDDDAGVWDRIEEAVRNSL